MWSHSVYESVFSKKKPKYSETTFQLFILFSSSKNRGVRLIDISLKTNEFINSLVLSALKNFSQWINLDSHWLFLGSYVKIRSNCRHSQIWLSNIYLYPEQPYQVKEYGVTEVTSFPVGGKVFLQQTSECWFFSNKIFWNNDSLTFSEFIDFHRLFN